MSVALSPEAAAPVTKFVDARACGSRYGVSWRHWLRLVDSGRAPQPVRFGRLVRWPLAALDTWEAAGCPSCRRAGK